LDRRGWWGEVGGGGGQDKLVETLKYFDSLAKTDVYYKAQLIAVGLTERGDASDCWIIKNIQPISVGV
jgi:hypothetical protein